MFVTSTDDEPRIYSMYISTFGVRDQFCAATE
jgi:hypothetical protein